MLPRITVHLTSDLIRVEIVGHGRVWEDLAVVAVRFDATCAPPIVVAAVGRGALSLAEDMKAHADQSTGGTRLVTLDAASWWNHGLLRPDGQPRPGDPSSHHGETIIAWPLREASFSPAMIDAVLRYALAQGLARAHGELGMFRMLWWSYACVNVHLGEDLGRQPFRDKVVCALWGVFGERLSISGARPTLSNPPRLVLMSWRQWASVAMVALLYAVATAKIIRHASSWLRAGAGVVLLTFLLAVLIRYRYRDWYFGRGAG